MDSEQAQGLAWVIFFLLFSIGYGAILFRRLIAENHARRPRPEPPRFISLLIDDDGTVTGVKGTLYALGKHTGEMFILRWGPGSANARSERDTMTPT